MKKLFIGLLSLFLLTGCGLTNTEQPNNQGENTKLEYIQESSDKNFSISIMIFDDVYTYGNLFANFYCTHSRKAVRYVGGIKNEKGTFYLEQNFKATEYGEEDNQLFSHYIDLAVPLDEGAYRIFVAGINTQGYRTAIAEAKFSVEQNQGGGSSGQGTSEDEKESEPSPITLNNFTYTYNAETKDISVDFYTTLGIQETYLVIRKGDDVKWKSPIMIHYQNGTSYLVSLVFKVTILNPDIYTVSMYGKDNDGRTTEMRDSANKLVIN